MSVYKRCNGQKSMMWVLLEERRFKFNVNIICIFLYVLYMSYLRYTNLGTRYLDNFKSLLIANGSTNLH